MRSDSEMSYGPTTALIVVDVQNDFADPDGSLYVDGAEDIFEPINDQVTLARAEGATVVLTQDWHPPATPHFTSGGGTWPEHCVRHTWGAALHPQLRAEADLIVRKGTGGEDGYSAFTVVDPETEASSPTGLGGYLRDRSIEDVVVVGLAADVCVKATALDAAEEGFVSSVLWSATRPVEAEAGDGDLAREELEDAGVVVIEE